MPKFIRGLPRLSSKLQVLRSDPQHLRKVFPVAAHFIDGRNQIAPSLLGHNVFVSQSQKLAIRDRVGTGGLCGGDDWGCGRGERGGADEHIHE
jgi:hypothetical protein